MVDKRTEERPQQGTPDFGAILARGVSASSSAIGALAVNTAPTAAMAQALAMLANATTGTSETSATVLTDDSKSIVQAAEFAEAKQQLRNLVSDAERAISGMMPGPLKTAAQGVLATAATAMPNNIRGIIDAIKDLIADAKTKEIGDDALAARREQLEAEREAKIRQLREEAYKIIDNLEAKGYIDEKQKKELDDQKATIEAMEARKDELEALKKTRALSAEEQKEYQQLKQDLPQARIENAENRIEIAQSVEQAAIRKGDTVSAEQARELFRTSTLEADLGKQQAKSLLDALDEPSATQSKTTLISNTAASNPYDAKDVSIETAHSSAPNIQKTAQQDIKEQNGSPSKPTNNVGVTF